MKVQSFLLFLLIFVSFNIIYSQKHRFKTTIVDNQKYLIKENLITKSPNRIYDIKGIYSIAEIKDENNVKEILSVSKKLFKDLEKITKFNFGDLELQDIEYNNNLSVTFIQIYKGLRVLNSEVGFSIKNDGKLLSFGADYYYDIDIKHNPVIDKKHAINLIKNNMTCDNFSIKKNPELFIYPKRNDNSMNYYLIWNIEIFDSTKFEKIGYYIDAQNGNIIEKIPLSREGGHFGGNLKYKFFPFHHSDTPIIATCNNMKVQIYNGITQKLDEIYTNSSGYFETSTYLSYSQYFVYLLLKNDFVEVKDRNVLLIEYLYNFNNTSATNLVTYGYPYTPLRIYDKTWEACDATNLYYHVNYAHDYFKNIFNYSEMDYPMVATFDAGLYINGRADGTNMDFGYQNGKFWARAADVIYHEYVHNVIHHIYNGFIERGSSLTSQAIAMDEGLADFFACSITGDPIMGESVDVNRNLNNNYVWNPANDRYYNGQVIGGACWDLRNTIGTNNAEQIIFKALQLTPKARNFQDFLENLLLADVILNNGINRNNILIAFNKYNIQPEILSVEMSGPTNLLEYQIGTWTISVNGGVPPYTYKWSYFISCDVGSGMAAAPCGYWFDLYTTTNILTRYDSKDFELKCLVTDALNQSTATSSNINISSIQQSIKNRISELDNLYKTDISDTISLFQNYPNPFNPITNINFTLPHSEHIKIEIFNTIGQLIEVLVNETFNEGTHSLKFNAKNLPSGVYYYRMVFSNKIITKQMILTK